MTSSDNIGEQDAIQAGICVLVVDKVESTRSRLAALIHRLDGVSTVLPAAGSREVWDCLSRFHPPLAVIVLQWDERGMLNMIQRLEREYPDTTILALTSYSFPQYASALRRYGVNHCFHKETEMDEAMRALAGLIRETAEKNKS